MEEYRVLFKVKLTERHSSTGNTVHYSGGVEIGHPAALAIAQYEGDEGFYLFYLDDGGEELADTYHDTLSSAKQQADFEFKVKEGDWLRVEQYSGQS